MQLLMEGADELCQDAQRLINFQRNNSRQLQQIDAYKAKRVSFDSSVMLLDLKALEISLNL